MGGKGGLRPVSVMGMLQGLATGHLSVGLPSAGHIPVGWMVGRWTG